MQKQNWNEIEARERFDLPTPGAYIARIEAVEDHEEKQYLRIEWDFAEGEYKGGNRETCQRAGFWPGVLFRSYKPAALGFFKAFKTALEQSNPGYTFDEDDLQDMVGRLVGVVLGEEEYGKRDGSVGRRLYVAQTRSVEAVRRGDFKVPALKRLAGRAAPSPPWPMPEDDGELPF